MESRGNRLSFLAVGLGLLALLVALSSRSSAPQVSIQVPQAPAAVVPGAPQAAPAAPAAPGPAFGRERGWGQPDRAVYGRRGDWGHQSKFGGGRHHRPGPFFLGGLLRTLVGLGLIGLGLWWLRSRRGPGGWGGPGGPGGSGGRHGRGWGGRRGPGGWRGRGPEFRDSPYRQDGPQVTHL